MPSNLAARLAALRDNPSEPSPITLEERLMDPTEAQKLEQELERLKARVLELENAVWRLERRRGSERDS